jgi:hypothetical protein
MARFSPRSVSNRRKSRRMIVAFSRALVERAADGQLDVPPPREHRVGGKVDIDMAKQHRCAVIGCEPNAQHPVLHREAHAHRRTGPEFSMSPARGERIEREALPKIHSKSITVTTGPPSGFKTSPRPSKNYQPIRPAAVRSPSPPIRKHRARKVILDYVIPRLHRAT